jgi:hypothetical protein
MMITQVIRIGPFQPPDMIFKLANEEQKRGENQKRAPFQTPSRRRLQDENICFLG